MIADREYAKAGLRGLGPELHQFRHWKSLMRHPLADKISAQLRGRQLVCARGSVEPKDGCAEAGCWIRAANGRSEKARHTR